MPDRRRPVMPTTAPHPAEDMPQGARDTLDLLAQGQQPPIPCPWVAALEARHLIYRQGRRVVGYQTTSGEPVEIDGWAVMPAALRRWRAWNAQRGTVTRRGR